MSFIDKKLSAQVLFSDRLIIDNSQRSNTGKNQIFCNLPTKSTQIDKKDFGGTNSS